MACGARQGLKLSHKIASYPTSAVGKMACGARRRVGNNLGVESTVFVENHIMPFMQVKLVWSGHEQAGMRVPMASISWYFHT
jgi:hypothetical protein